MNELVRRMASVSLLKATLRTTPRALSQLAVAVPDRNELGSCRLPHSRGPAGMGSFHLATQRMQFSTQASTEVASGSSTASIVTDETSGQQYGVLLDTRKLPKLKPGLVQKRLAKCKTYIGREQSIRQSPWKLNRICQLAAGLTLEEALTQLKFCDLKNSDLVAKVLKRTSNLADIRHGIQMSQLEVAECFTNKSLMLRRVKPMGRGR
jgi:large subunit ribosomal protein L22